MVYEILNNKDRVPSVGSASRYDNTVIPSGTVGQRLRSKLFNRVTWILESSRVRIFSPCNLFGHMQETRFRNRLLHAPLICFFIGIKKQLFNYIPRDTYRNVLIRNVFRASRISEWHRL